MLRNYFKIAIRSLIKNKTYSFINIVGLSVGIAVSLIIFLYVVHEFSYDKFHTKADKIYRLKCKINYGGQEINTTAMSSQFGPILKDNNPDVENYVRVRSPGRVLIQSDENHINYEEAVAFSDTSFFSTFSFPVLRGDYRLLARPSTAIITKKMALKYFGSTDVLGKKLLYNKNYLLEIVGVAKDFPSNSTFQFDFIVSFSTLGIITEEKSGYNWANASLGSIPTYIVVNNERSVSKIVASIPQFAKTSVDEKYSLEKFAGTHLGNNLGDSSNITYLYLFMAVAIIILLLALINYMNLTTARATLRAKEVGVRKVIGARQNNLAYQFYFESTFMTLLAFGLAWVWLEMLLPVFLNILQIQIDGLFLTSTWFISVAVGLLLSCVLLAGSYPAMVLSRFVPAEVLKGKASRISGGSVWIRKGFTVVQFTASIALILVTLGIQHQLDFLRNQKIGLNKEQVMVINLDKESATQFVAMKNDLRNLSGVQQVAAASIPLFVTGHNAMFAKTPTTNEDVFIGDLTVDENFISTLGIEWLEKPDTLTKGGYIINESALATLKISKEDIGVKLSGLPINGIVKDFNYQSLRQKIEGMVLSIQPDSSKGFSYGVSLYVRLDPKSNLSDKIASVLAIHKKYQGNRPFEYYFLDEAFDKLYKSEDRLSQIFNAFTVIAIVIACMGLFGLITFTAEVRNKEIGIRKVLGASVRNIFGLLSKEFFVLVLIGVAIAIPASWWYLQNWLEQFSYKTEIPWWFAVLAACSALVISFLTICTQAIKAAMGNPVESLRSE
jgi:putative ABC transport system permease protein